MALDPSISLAVRPPVIPPLQIQTPLEKFAKIQTLRNLMTQGQLGQLGLQTKQLELQREQQAAEETRSLANLFQARQTQPPAPAVTAPIAGASGAPLSTLVTPQAPVMRPDAKSGPYLTTLTPQEEAEFQTWVKTNKVPFDPSPTADYDMRGFWRSMMAGQSTRSSENLHFPDTFKTPYHQSFSNESMYATADAPHWEGNRLIDKSGQVVLDESQGGQAPTAAPVTPTAAVPGRAPSAAAVSIPDPYAGLPSDAEIIRQAPTSGFAIVKNLNAAREAYYKQQQEKIKLHQSALTGLASLAAGAHDEPSKVEAIAAAFNNKWIDAATRDQLMSHPYNKKEWDDFAVNSLEGDKRLEELRKQVNQTALEKKQAHDQAMYGPEEKKATAEATTAEQKAAGTEPITPQQLITNTETARHNQRVEELTGQGHTQQQATAIANIEGKLRDDFNQATKTFPAVREAYGRIHAAKDAPPSGASDIALLYGYMKVLDPGSTVREGEFATASNAGGIPDKIVAMYNKILRGDRLSPNVRTEMLDNVERLYSRATEDYQKTSQQFTDISKRSGADPRNVVIDYTTTAKKSPQTVTPEVQKVLAGAERGKIHQLSDGSVWLVNADGSIQPATAPK